MDVYAIVTEKIISLLEQSIVPWRRPWTGSGLPRNVVSKKPYRGINHFLLSASKYVETYWLTMRQANELGGHVRKGEESTIIVFWKVEDGHGRDQAQDESHAELDEPCRRRFVLRCYRVWNVEQCELLEKALEKLPRVERHEHDPIEAVERIVAAMPNAPTIEHAGSKAFYSNITDHRSNYDAAPKAVHLHGRIQRYFAARIDSLCRLPDYAAYFCVDLLRPRTAARDIGIIRLCISSHLTFDAAETCRIALAGWAGAGSC